MRQTELRLSKRERRIVDEFRSKRLHRAREFNRDPILAALDRKAPERQIMELLNVGRTALWRTRAASDKPGLLSLPQSQALLRRISENEIDTGVKLVALVAAPLRVKALKQRCDTPWGQAFQRGWQAQASPCAAATSSCRMPHLAAA